MDFASTAIARRALAPVNAELGSYLALSRRKGREKVYNIATSDGTYYAEGYLVSNCDCLRYAVVFRPPNAAPPPNPERFDTLHHAIMKHKKQVNQPFFAGW